MKFKKLKYGMVPERLRDFIGSIGSPNDLEVLDRGGISIDGQWVLDIVQRYTALYLDYPEKYQNEHPEWKLTYEQRVELMDWLKETSPTGIDEYKKRCREDDVTFAKYNPKRERMEDKIKRLFPEAYEVIFED